MAESGSFNDCRPPYDLAAFISGKLPASETDAIAQHIESCVQCEMLVAQLSQNVDSVVGALRRSDILVPTVNEDIGIWLRQHFEISPPQTEDLAFPEQCGPYKIVRKIGQGGMGAVYEAFHVNLKRRVAIKTIRAERAGDFEHLRRFRLEMEAVGRLQHPHVVQATDAGEHDGTHFIAMEYLEGCSLAELRRDRGTLDPMYALSLVRQATLGLQFAGENGIVHRDIKPSNLFLTNQGVVKIIDLGLAKALMLLELGNEGTSFGRILGTPDYIAPEQARQLAEIDIRADIYSLGCTLYELLVGEPPFPSHRYRSSSAKIIAHCTESPVSIATSRPELPFPVVQLVEDMMAREAQERPLPQDVLIRIDRILGVVSTADGAGKSALSESAFEVLTKSPAVADLSVRKRIFPRRHRTILLGGALSLLVLSAASAFLLLGPSLSGNLPDDGFDGGAASTSVWVNQLAKPPEVVHWPEGDVRRFAWHPERKEVVFATDDNGLLSLGTANAADYRLQVSLQQVRWTGGVGIFFGMHPTVFKEKPAIAYRFIRLNSISVKPGTFTLTHGWAAMTTVAGARRFNTTTVCEQVIDAPQGEQRIEIEVRSNALHAVLLNGRRVATLVDEEFRSLFPDNDLRGAFGLCAFVSEGTLREAFLKTSPPQR